MRWLTGKGGLRMTKYITKAGDVWDYLAFTLLGSELRMHELMALNGRYAHYAILPAGLTLRIPETGNLTTVTDLPPWRRGNG